MFLSPWLRNLFDAARSREDRRRRAAKGRKTSISSLGAGSTLTIEGKDGTNYTLTGDGNRLFAVASGQKVTFADLTLTGGGNVQLGGAILDRGGDVTGA